MCILMFAIMEGLFLSSLMKGKSSKNGRLPALANYVWPPLFAGVITVVLYFVVKSSYDNNGVQ